MTTTLLLLFIALAFLAGYILGTFAESKELEFKYKVRIIHGDTDEWIDCSSIEFDYSIPGVIAVIMDEARSIVPMGTIVLVYDNF